MASSQLLCLDWLFACLNVCVFFFLFLCESSQRMCTCCACCSVMFFDTLRVCLSVRPSAARLWNACLLTAFGFSLASFFLLSFFFLFFFFFFAFQSSDANKTKLNLHEPMYAASTTTKEGGDARDRERECVCVCVCVCGFSTWLCISGVHATVPCASLRLL